ncbi:FMN-dependent NADH-azoreductase [Deinococcus yavapaiensis]|uniref:FMN dependent NADH:quinone oxidoreductase n=1 Tax=Deinococcus yavapaiensis KR-236 TaxID=694435 RepID=A0A318S5F3_9DEIO|nr:NAD(P)H-dependent oxidoreductase [Deinococcus yavapaiensis]PYE49382.1 FMN-dependent NADH-azoreductase [Deinococcus yavapaiensis KR-236]
MATLLRVDASPRNAQSYSRQVAQTFETQWRGAHPDGRVINRDLALQQIPHLTAETIQGFFTPPAFVTDDLKRATTVSDVLLAELHAADTVLISTPMYNFCIPSSLKAWIDQVVRVHHTFEVDADGSFRGLVKGKKIVVVTASGSAYADMPLASLDFLHTYLRAVLGFIGFETSPSSRWNIRRCRNSP